MMRTVTWSKVHTETDNLYFYQKRIENDF
jgi:hypothetical protein